MSIRVTISKPKDWDDADSVGIVCRQGIVDVDKVLLWIVDNFNSILLANSMSVYVKVVEANKLVLSGSYLRTEQFSDIVVDEGFNGLDPYGWRYEFVGVAPRSNYDFAQLLFLLGTYAKAWGEEYPRELGTVMDQLKALEPTSV